MGSSDSKQQADGKDGKGSGEGEPARKLHRAEPKKPRDKKPQQIVINRPRASENHPVLSIPSSKYKVVFVDPEDRGDVVASHGYIAVKGLGVSRRMSKGDLATSMFRRKSSVAVERDPEDAKRRAEAAIEEADEKAAALDTFKAFAEAETEEEAAAATAPPRPGTQEEGQEDDDPLAADPFSDPVVKKKKNKGDDDPFGGSRGSSRDGTRKQELPAAELTHENTPAAAPVEQDPFSMDNADIAEKNEMLPGNGEEQAAKETHFESQPQSGEASTQERSLMHRGKSVAFGLPQDVSPDYRYGGKQQLFIYPRGNKAAERVYFFDSKKSISADQLEPSLGSRHYELEEDEIHEMAGVHRATPRRVAVDEEDPLYTYEPQSSVLDAIRLAIEAPIADFRIETFVEEDENEVVRAFKEAAMKEAKGLFDAAIEADMTFAKTFANKKRVDAAGTMLAGGTMLGTLVRSKSSSKSNSQVGVGTFGRVMEEFAVRFEDLSPEEQADIKKRKKELQKKLNSWKADFCAINGRQPLAWEMAQDDNIADVFREYTDLKKYITAKKEEGEAEPEVARGKTPGKLEPIQTELTLADKKELRKLTKEVKAWKKMWRDREGAVPTKGDIRSDPEIGPKYDRLKFLQGLHDPWEGREPDEAEEEQQQPEMTEEEERAALEQEVKQWKKEFKMREGRRPLRSEIRSDLIIGPKYDRLKELEGAGGEGEEGNLSRRGSVARRPTETETPAPPEFDGTLVGEGGEGGGGGGLTKEEKKELKKLKKAVKEWKKEFNDREGRAPTKKEIKADEEMGPVYDRMKELEALEKQGGQGEEDGGRPVLTEEEIEREMVNIEEREPIARRDIEADENNDWNGLMQDFEDAVPSAFRQEDVVELTETGEAGRTIQLEGTMEPFMKPKPKVLGGWGITEELDQTARSNSMRKQSFGSMGSMRTKKVVGFSAEAEIEATAQEEALALAKRRKDLGKELNSWKETFTILHGKPPTTKDIKSDPGIAAVFEEYQSIPRDIGKQVGGAAASSSTTANPETLKRKKSLAKELNAWKQSYKERNGAEPTTKVILSDPAIAPVYEEYLELKKQEKEAGAEAEEEDEGKRVARRRKELAKELNEWKQQYIEQHGHAPTPKDIKADIDMAPLYEEFLTLPKDTHRGSVLGLATAGPKITAGLAATGAAATFLGAISKHAQGQEGENDGGGVDLKAVKKRKKQLGKQLNEWKSEFHAREGRKPKEADIRGDAEIGPLYEEYLALQAQEKEIEEREDNAEVNASPMIPQQRPPSGGAEPQGVPTIEVVPATDMDPAQKRKHLGKRLNAWKRQFAEVNGRNPTGKDLLGDPEIADIYKEYQALPKDPNATFAGTVNFNGTQLQRPSSATFDVDQQQQQQQQQQQPQQQQQQPQQQQQQQQQEEEVQQVRPQTGDADEVDEEGGKKHKKHHKRKGKQGESPEPGATEGDANAAATAGGGPVDAESGGPPPPDYDALRKEKKALTKELNAWKKQFTAVNGKAPTSSDIKGDEGMHPLYERLKDVKSMLAAMEGDVGED